MRKRSKQATPDVGGLPLIDNPGYTRAYVGRRSKQINTRIEDELQQAAETAAATAGQTLSEFVRAAIVAALDRCPFCGSQRGKRKPKTTP